MRKLFFFSCGLILAFALVILLNEEQASSARIRPPALRATVLYPAAKDSDQLAVSFSHASHARFGYKKCTECHNDEVFSKEKSLGADNINMDDIYKGKWCGHCHNGKLLTLDEDGKEKAVFAPIMESVSMCNLCHNVKEWKKPEKGWNPPDGIKPAEGLPEFLKK